MKPTQANLVANTLGLDVANPPTNILFRFQTGNGSHTGMIDALEEDGLIKILAEPNLIAMSGETAKFLAGGEYPVPIPQGLGTVGIQYKEYGVSLSFTPTVVNESRISIRVTPEVSELDFATAVRIEGYVIPGLNTRRATTAIEVEDGQSFAIAGLLKDNVRDDVAKYPFLGDIPVLGNLFRSRLYQSNETELIIIVTPHLVKPLDPRRQALPTNYYMEPDALDFYVLGSMEGRRKSSTPPQAEVELDGAFGHSIPVLE